MNKTKIELKHKVSTALKSEYGFAPALNKIILLEAHGDGTYILFRVGIHEYRYDSYFFFPEGSDNTVWYESGTIQKLF